MPSEIEAINCGDGVEDGVSNTKPSYPVSLPPARFSTDAKAAWDEAPEVVRAEVLRMEREFTAGFAKHRAAAERDALLAEFHDMAAKCLSEEFLNHMNHL